MPPVRPIIATMLLLLALPACSLPRIVILHDPLSADEHLRLASIYDKEENHDLAGEHYRTAIKKGSRHVQAWMLLGDFCFRRKEFTAAKDAYEKAISLDPRNGDAYNNLAWVHLHLPEGPETARKLAEKALSLTPDHRPYYLDTLGVALLRLGKPAEAIVIIRESIASLPMDTPEFAAEAYEHLEEACRAAADTACAAVAEIKAQELRNRR